MEKSGLVWVDIDMVLPNPKNPRINPGVKTKEMQKIINEKGWEEGITAYKRGKFYIIISGHRRWFAAKEMKLPTVPIYIVPAPKDDKEELERLGSIQGSQVDWTPYEWCEFTHKMYEELGKPSYSQLASKFNVSHSLIAARIRVYEYYPRVEIETKLENKMYSVTILEYLRGWIERFKKYQPDLLAALEEQTVRQMMLKKLENKCFNSDIFYDQFVIKASSRQMMDFLTDTKKTLANANKEIISDVERVIRVTNTKHNLRKVRNATKEVNTVSYRTKKEAEQVLESLISVQEEIDAKRKQLLKTMKKEKITR